MFIFDCSSANLCRDGILEHRTQLELDFNKIKGLLNVSKLFLVKINENISLNMDHNKYMTNYLEIDIAKLTRLVHLKFLMQRAISYLEKIL